MRAATIPGFQVATLPLRQAARQIAAAPPGGSNPNLLSAPEDFTNAAWAKIAVTVTADTGDPTHPNADRLVMASPRFVRQTTSIACTVATGALTGSADFVWGRREVDGLIDGVPYVWSVELSPSSAWRIRLTATGGFAAVLIDGAGSAADILAWGAKLEQGSSFSGYP